MPTFPFKFLQIFQELEKIDGGARQDQCGLKHAIGVLGHLIQGEKTQGQANF